MHLSLRPQRQLMRVLGAAGRLRDVPVERVAEGVSVRLHRPDTLPAKAPAVLWLHAGGGVMGTAVQDDTFCRRLSHLAGVAVAAVEYRLAPEFSYPIPVEDCYLALGWLARQAWVDPGKLAVGGASAGGQLATTVAMRARDRGEVALQGQLLTYPMIDDRTGRQPDHEPRIMWSGRDNQRAWRCYLGGADPVAAVPLRQANLTNLPPAWIGVGSLDLFYRESIEYAERLRQSGVWVHTEVVDGAFHAFDQLAPHASSSLAFFASQCAYLRRTLGVVG